MSKSMKEIEEALQRGDTHSVLASILEKLKEYAKRIASNLDVTVEAQKELEGRVDWLDSDMSSLHLSIQALRDQIDTLRKIQALEMRVAKLDQKLAAVRGQTYAVFYESTYGNPRVSTIQAYSYDDAMSQAIASHGLNCLKRIEPAPGRGLGDMPRDTYFNPPRGE